MDKGIVTDPRVIAIEANLFKTADNISQQAAQSMETEKAYAYAKWAADLIQQLEVQHHRRRMDFLDLYPSDKFSVNYIENQGGGCTCAEYEPGLTNE